MHVPLVFVFNERVATRLLCFAIGQDAYLLKGGREGGNGRGREGGTEGGRE